MLSLIDRVVGASKGITAIEEIQPKIDCPLSVSIQRHNDVDKLLELARWLRENVGRQAVAWDISEKVVVGHTLFMFVEEEMAMAFKIVWGEE